MSGQTKVKRAVPGRFRFPSAFTILFALLVRVLFAATFAVMICGLSNQGWWMARMNVPFALAAILIGSIAGMGMSFVIPSSCGLAVLSMPILAPAADYASGDRALAVIAIATGKARQPVVRIREPIR